MISLQVKVPTKYKLLPGYTLRRQIPENWSEVGKKQLLGYCCALNGVKNDAELRIMAAMQMLRLPWWLFFIVNKYQLAEITYELRWLNTEPLTRNLLPNIKSLYGPADSFSNVRFAEFAVASIYYQRYMQTQHLSVLDYLIAVLYRPLDKQTAADSPDRRVKYEQHLIEKNVRTVTKLRPEIKQAVLLYFAGCMSEMAMRYTEVFAPSLSDKDSHLPSESTGSSDWLDFMRHLPSDKFGSLETIENSLVHPVMEVANRMMRDAKKEKAKLKRRPHHS